MTPEAAANITEGLRYDWERVMGVRPGMTEAERAQAIARTSDAYSRIIQDNLRLNKSTSYIVSEGVSKPATAQETVSDGSPQSIRGTILDFPVGGRPPLKVAR